MDLGGVWDFVSFSVFIFFFLFRIMFAPTCQALLGITHSTLFLRFTLAPMLGSTIYMDTLFFSLCNLGSKCYQSIYYSFGPRRSVYLVSAIYGQYYRPMAFERMILSHHVQSSLTYRLPRPNHCNPSLLLPFDYARCSPSNYPVGQHNFLEQAVRLHP